MVRSAEADHAAEAAHSVAEALHSVVEVHVAAARSLTEVAHMAHSLTVVALTVVALTVVVRSHMVEAHTVVALTEDMEAWVDAAKAPAHAPQHSSYA